MTWSTHLTLAAVALGVAACASPRVETRFDPAVDFQALRTFALEKLETGGLSGPMADPRLRTTLENAVARALTQRGLRQVSLDERPDLVVHYWVAVASPSARTSGGSSGGRQGAAKGALVVELTRGVSPTMVWRADIVETLSEDRDANLRRAEAAVEEAFSNYPPVRMR